MGVDTPTQTHIYTVTLSHIVNTNRFKMYFDTEHGEGENVNIENCILTGSEAGTCWPSSKWSKDMEASRTDHPFNGNFVMAASIRPDFSAC
jgi:hypothetical protein